MASLRANKENHTTAPRTPSVKGLTSSSYGDNNSMNNNNPTIKKSVLFKTPGAKDENHISQQHAAFGKDGKETLFNPVTPRTVLGGKDKNVHRTMGGEGFGTIKEKAFDKISTPFQLNVQNHNNNNNNTNNNNQLLHQQQPSQQYAKKNQTMVFIDEPQVRQIDPFDREVEFIPDPVAELPFTPFISDDDTDADDEGHGSRRRNRLKKSRHILDYEALGKACRNPSYPRHDDDEMDYNYTPKQTSIQLAQELNLDMESIPELPSLEDLHALDNTNMTSPDGFYEKHSKRNKLPVYQDSQNTSIHPSRKIVPTRSRRLSAKLSAIQTAAKLQPPKGNNNPIPIGKPHVKSALGFRNNKLLAAVPKSHGINKSGMAKPLPILKKPVLNRTRPVRRKSPEVLNQIHNQLQSDIRHTAPASKVPSFMGLTASAAAKSKSFNNNNNNTPSAFSNSTLASKSSSSSIHSMGNRFSRQAAKPMLSSLQTKNEGRDMFEEGFDDNDDSRGYDNCLDEEDKFQEDVDISSALVDLELDSLLADEYNNAHEADEQLHVDQSRKDNMQNKKETVPPNDTNYEAMTRTGEKSNVNNREELPEINETSCVEQEEEKRHSPIPSLVQSSKPPMTATLIEPDLPREQGQDQDHDHDHDQEQTDNFDVSFNLDIDLELQHEANKLVDKDGDVNMEF